LPTPNKNESKNDFISRCIPYVIHEGTAKDNKQAAAICHSIWRRSKGVKETKKDDRVLLHLHAELEPYIDLEKEKPDIGLERSTVLVGDKTFNGIYFPAEEVKKALPTFDKQPININHSDLVEDIVGWVEAPEYKSEGHRLTVKPILDAQTVKYQVAKGYINSRMTAGRHPEVSVGVWVDREHEFNDDGELERIIARNLQGDHLALVNRGACSPEDGCGIGLNKDTSELEIKYTFHTSDGHDFIYTEPENHVWLKDYTEEEHKKKANLSKQILKEKIRKEELNGR